MTVIDSQAAPAFRQRSRIDKLVRALGAPQTDADVEFMVDPEIRMPEVPVLSADPFGNQLVRKWIGQLEPAGCEP